MFPLDFPNKVEKAIAKLDLDDILQKLAGLALYPEYQDNHLRIVALTQLAIAKARGGKKASGVEVGDLLNLLVDENIGRREDPSEDVFVTAITLENGGDHRLFSGNIPSSDFFLQRLVDAMFALEDVEIEPVLGSVRALLSLSEAIAERLVLPVNSVAEGKIWRTTWPKSLPTLLERGRAAVFTNDDLTQLGVTPDLLEPFVLRYPDALLEDSNGGNEIMARPVLRVAQGWMLPVPSLVSPALRLFIAQAMLDGRLPREPIIDHLETMLLARWLTYDLFWRGHRALQIEDMSLDPPAFQLPGNFQSAVFRFDEDKVVHLMILGADWDNVPKYALYGSHFGPWDLKANLNAYIRDSAKALAAQLGSARGITLVLFDSPGWFPSNLEVDGNGPGDWPIVSAPSSAFAMLLADPDFNMLDLWKMFAEIDAIEARDIRISFWPELINHWCSWREFGNSFHPPGIDLDAFGQLAGDTGHIQGWAAMVRSGALVHGARNVNGDYERVERWEDRASPIAHLAQRKFFQPMAGTSGLWRLVNETHGALWWISTARPPYDLEDQHYLYLLWQAAHEWALRLIDSPSNPITGPQCLELRLLPVPEQVAGQPNGIDLNKVHGFSVVTLIVPHAFVERQVTQGNEGERELVEAIARAAALALDVDLADEVIRAWVDDVTRDPTLKMIHVTYSGDLPLAIDGAAEKARLRGLQIHDLQIAGRRTRDLLPPGALGSERSGPIEGQQASLAALNAIVDGRWMWCRDGLRELDRVATLKLLTRLIEAVHRDRVSDERAALARTSLYADAEDLRLHMVRNMSERDGAFRSYRVLAEMALCECPASGGREPGLSDIDALAAEIAFLVSQAEHSDAIKHELVPATLMVMADGAMSSASDGIVAVASYLRASLEEVTDQDIESYGELYEKGPFGPPELPGVDDPLLEAFQAELGIPMLEAARASVALQQLALDEGGHVVAMPRSRMIERLAELETGIDADRFDTYLAAFGLKHRPNWSEPIPPFRRDDIWPWLFERRLSLMMRPILISDESDDPLLIYGVRQAEMATQYVAHLLEEGIWPRERLESASARAFIDAEVNRRGKAFEAQVARIIDEAGWQTFPGIPMKSLGAPKQLGDLDVLAVSPSGEEWLVIECKWFGAARTAREIANWMQDYHGKGGDKLERHLNRHAWIAEHKDEVAKRLKIAMPKTILGRIATTRPVPLTFTRNLPAIATVWTIRDLNRQFPPVT